MSRLELSQFPVTNTPTEYTIDELAAAARVPSRTIRFYQARGALMPPELRGRVAYYGAAHLERLQLIAQLQDRGLRIAAIRDLMASVDRGEVGIAEWLGVEQQVQAAWGEDRPRTLSAAELYELAGSRRPGLLAELARAKLVDRRGDTYLLHSPALLAVAMRLEAAGVDLETAAGAADLVRRAMTKLSAALVGYCVDRIADGSIRDPDLEGLFAVLRPAGIEAARVMFAREMERALRKSLESGALAALPARARKRKR